jgi:hypothetical protein
MRQLSGLLCSMRKITGKMIRLYPLVILFCSVNVYAQFIKVRSAGNGRARVSTGKRMKALDLSRDISGCFRTYDGTDPRRKLSDATVFDVIDSVHKHGALYLVVLAKTGGNCNVQGYCGATQDLTLIWLKLSNDLTVLAKKAAVIESCHYSSVVLEPEGEEGVNPVKMINGGLKVTYSENKYQRDLDYRLNTLVYTRAEAENGFRIISEKRPRPQN